MEEHPELADENQKLKRQLAEVHRQREQERIEYEEQLAQERSVGLDQEERAQQRTVELESMKKNVVRLTRQLDEEVKRCDQVQAESQMLERRVQDLGQDGLALSTRQRPQVEEEDHAARERGSQISTKLMRVVDQWMRHRDLQQALLRGAAINDQAFGTLVQALSDCASLHTLDLSQNLLTMDSCSDLCQLITTAPQLSFLSLADNLFSLRSIGYFMTAVMERQNTKKLMPLDLLDLQGNEGLVAAASAPAPEALLKQVSLSLKKDQSKLPPKGAELVAQVMRALWRFLHDTGHPQVRDSSPNEITFHVMDKVTLRKMEGALTKILLLGVDGEDGLRPVTANLALYSQLDNGRMQDLENDIAQAGVDSASPKLAQTGRAQAVPHAGTTRDLQLEARSPTQVGIQSRPEVKDPFADLKAAFEPPREKLKTFNLKQIVNSNGVVLMNMLERLLETVEIDAYDVETQMTLLEFACTTGNMGLAKLCYRRGAKLSAKTKKGDTAFNIVTRNKRYDIMEFLHKYGVKVNSADRKGTTAMHVAAENDDCDGICRLIEWGADVNIRDKKLRTPIHIAAGAGNTKATLLLLEVGAEMNAKDEKLFTAAAHANMNSHFALFDRLTTLGGQIHEQRNPAMMRSSSAKKVGQLVVSAGMLKSSSLGRIGKVTVSGLPGPIRPSQTLDKK